MTSICASVSASARTPEPQQLVLQLVCGDRGAARPVDVDASRPQQGVAGPVQRRQVEHAERVLQRLDVAGDRLLRGRGRAVARRDRLVHGWVGGRQFLREGDLEILVPLRLHPAAEAEDRRVADAAALGKLHHGEMDDLVRVVQHVLADLLLLLVERGQQSTYHQQKIG